MTFSSSECITWLALFITISITIITVNLLSIVLFITNRSLRTRTMYLVINLTTVDMFVGGFSSLYHLLLLECDIWEIHLTLGLTIIIEFRCIWFPLTSLTNIEVISLERMHATIPPFRHRLIKKWVYGVTIAGVWVSAAMVSTAILILEVYVYGKEFLYLLQSYCFLCLLVICVSYSSIVVKFLCGAHPQHHGAVRRQGKLTVTLFIMTIVSLLMWLPHAVFIFLYQTGARKFLSSQESVRLDFSLKILYFMNSLVNPIVYTIRIPEFRKALLVLFKRQQRQNADVIHLHVR